MLVALALATVPAIGAAQELRLINDDHWIIVHKSTAETKLQDARARAQAAQSVVIQSQSALDRARQYRDAAAEIVAQSALEIARAAKARADALLRNADEAYIRLQAAAGTTVPNLAIAIPTRVSGSSIYIQAGGQRIPWDGRRALLPGDRISTGADTTINLVLPDLGTFIVRPNSEFIFQRSDPRTPVSNAWERTKLILLRGAGRFEQNSRSRVPQGGIQGSIKRYSPNSIVAVRGTAYELHVAENGLTRMVPHDGKVELSSDPDVPVTKHLSSPWWVESVSAADPTTGQVAVLGASRGTVYIEDAQGQSRLGSAGEVLLPGERLVTGADGLVTANLPHGQRVALSQSSRLHTGTDNTTSAPLFALRGGRAHVWGNGEVNPVRYLAANSVSASRAKEFEFAVLDNGLSEYTVIEGTIEVTAIGNRVDWSKVDAWWER